MHLFTDVAYRLTPKDSLTARMKITHDGGVGGFQQAFLGSIELNLRHDVTKSLTVFGGVKYIDFLTHVDDGRHGSWIFQTGFGVTY